MIMKKSHRNKHLDRSLGVVLAILILSGCSQKGVNDDAAPSIALHMKVTEPALIEQVSQFWLIVTGPGMDSIQTELTLSGGHLEGEVDVPAGRKRKFEVQARDQSNRLIYRGSTTVDVVPGETIDLTINLYPVVPLVKLSPRFQEVDPGSPCSVDVKVFRIRDLYGISFRIHYDSLIYPDSAVLASDLDPNLIFFEIIDSIPQVYAITVSQIDQSTPIVDRDGNASLARVFFTTNPEVSGIAQLTVEGTGLTRINSTPIADSIFIADSIYTDGCLIAVGCDSVVTFPDSLLEDAVRQAILKLEGDICLSEVLTIDTLYADGVSDVPGISDLTGLSHLVNLKFLELDLNQISDITELTPLTNLEMLFLAYNYQIQDITPLSGLVNLHMLDLSYNDITDIHPLIQNALNGGIGAGDVVLLIGNPLANTAQLDSLCFFGPAVFVEPDINWCQTF